MKYLHIILQIFILYLLFRIGEGIRELFHLPIPGSVIGLLLLFVLLMTGVLKEKYIKTGSGFMTKHLVLFFIPATVGIMNHIGLFKGKGMLLIVITVVSTVFVMGVSGLTSQRIYKKGEKEHA